MKHSCVAGTVFELGVGEGCGEIDTTTLLVEHAAAEMTRASSTPSSLIETVNGRDRAGLRRILVVVFKPDEAVWERFLAATRGQPAWGRLMKAAAMFSTPGEALDVGAGAGRDTAYLLEHGWRVTAVDASAAASKLLRTLGPGDRLQVVHSAAEDFEPATYDLVNAQFSLPFIPPASFAETVARLQKAVRPGGVMAVTFFGPRDEWNVAGSEMTFATQAEVAALFRDWDVVDLEEIEEDGTTATGGKKHWDVIHVIARSRREPPPASS